MFLERVTPGQRNQYVSIESPTRATDGDGGYTESWAAASPANAWVKIETATATNGERSIGGTIEAKASHIVSGQADDLAGVTTKSRLTTHASTVLAVRWIGRDYQHAGIVTLGCEEILS